MTTPNPSRRRFHSAVIRVLASPNIRQVFATVVVAGLLTGSALSSDQADDRWRAAIQEEMRWSAAATAALRQVYVTEAPLGLQVAMAQVRIENLEEVARGSGAARDLAILQVQAGRFWIQDLLDRTKSGGSLITERYYQPNQGFDVAARLGDYQSEFVDTLDSKTAEFLQAGDSWRTAAEIMAFAVIPVVVVYLLLDVLDAWRRSRSTIIRPGLLLPTTTDDVGLVPRPWATSRARRSTVLIAFVAWLLVGILPWLQLKADAEADRTQAESSIALARAAAGTGGAVHIRAFRDIAEATVTLADMEGAGNQWALAPAIAGTPTAIEENALIVFRAEEAALPALRDVAARMSRTPTELDGIEPALSRLIATQPEDWDRSAVQQTILLEESGAASDRASMLATALLLAMLTLTLTEMGLTDGGSRSTLIRHSAALVLGGAFAVAVLSMLG